MFINERKGESDVFNLDKQNSFSDVIDSELETKADNAHAESVAEDDIYEALDRVSSGNSWNVSDETVMKNTSTDKYYEVFKTVKGDRLNSYVRACLKFENLAGTNQQQQMISTNATSALARIGEEDKLNKLRVHKFGVKLEENRAEPNSTD